MFTGRWLHELSVGWLTPLDDTHPTLAEFLASRGYATAGFVANTPYCASDSGLGRGFTCYQDYHLSRAHRPQDGSTGRPSLVGTSGDGPIPGRLAGAGAVASLPARLLGVFLSDRKAAATVNRELLDWLAKRPQADRPFFAFLNYFDAHYPYLLPPGRVHRFGGAPDRQRQYRLIENWGDLDKNRSLRTRSGVCGQCL